MKGYTEIISDAPDKSTKSTQEKSVRKHRLFIRSLCTEKHKPCTLRQSLRTKKLCTG